jgi:alcohol dehydrogenase (cytochrome c)
MRRLRFKTLVLVTALLAIVAVSGAVIAVPDLNWRASLLRLKIGGGLEGLEWSELLRMIRPGSPYYLEPLVSNPNPYSVIRNPFNSGHDLKAGAALFRTRCSQCHGSEGHGSSATNLARGNHEHGDSDWALYRTIRHGIDDTAMPSQDLPDLQIWQLVAYTRSLARPDDALEAVSDDIVFRSISGAEILTADQTPEQWLTFSGNYSGQRYSKLVQITRENVTRLRIDWVHQTSTPDTIVEATPLVVGDVMYVTEPPSHVVALDARSGRQLWVYRHPLPDRLSLCCGRINRGVAVLGDRVFVSTLDAHLVALDARTGRRAWDAELAPHAQGYSATAAPLALKDKVIVGIAGGEFGIRGFLDAYDAQTGARVWRFETIPGPGQPGHDTWTGDSWRTGGGPTWMTGTYDPQLGLVYWGVGNPSPDHAGDVRGGDNLYTNSVVALDAETGVLRWHYQFTPHDVYDYDANQVPVLVDASWGGAPRKLLLNANKNGFFYVLDRQSGELLFATPLARTSWATSVGADGRPVRVPGTQPTARGTLVYPGPGGGANWWPPSFHRDSGLFVVPVAEQGKVFFAGAPEFREGEMFVGSTTEPASGEPSWSALRAIRPSTGEIAWQLRRPGRESFGMGGTLSTAGGLVFWGEDRELMALDAETGAVLWSMNLGGRILAAPITYMSEGRQRVAISAGRAVFTIGLGQP